MALDSKTASTGTDASARRRRRLRLLAGTAAAALVAVAVAVLLSSGSGDSTTDTEGPLAGGPEVEALLRGIPQDGVALGRPDAPITVVEYVDPQCPFCADAARDVLPPLIAQEVRRGEVRLELRVLTFLGPDSERLGQLFAGAAQQDRLWQVAEVAFRNQGRENSGYATDDFLRRVGEAVPDLDVDRALQDGAGAEGQALLVEASRQAQQAGVDSTPTFLAGRTGGTLRPVQLRELTAAALRSALPSAQQ